MKNALREGQCESRSVGWCELADLRSTGLDGAGWQAGEARRDFQSEGKLFEVQGMSLR